MKKEFMKYRIMASESTYSYNAEWIYKEFGTIAEVKSYLRYFYKEERKNIRETGYPFPITLWVLELDENEYEWYNLSQYWENISQDKTIEWCQRKGINPGRLFGLE